MQFLWGRGSTRFFFFFNWFIHKRLLTYVSLSKINTSCIFCFLIPPVWTVFLVNSSPGLSPEWRFYGLLLLSSFINKRPDTQQITHSFLSFKFQTRWYTCKWSLQDRSTFVYRLWIEPFHCCLIFHSRSLRPVRAWWIGPTLPLWLLLYWFTYPQTH